MDFLKTWFYIELRGEVYRIFNPCDYFISYEEHVFYFA
jgi:hypothetical protein